MTRAVSRCVTACTLAAAALNCSLKLQSHRMSVSNLRSTAAAVRTAARSTAAQTAQTTFEIAVATGSIDSMQALSESFTRKIEVERRRGEDLRNRLKVLLAKLGESRKLVPCTVDPETLRLQAAKLHALEHRLNKLTEKQNHTVWPCGRFCVCCFTCVCRSSVTGNLQCFHEARS